MNKADREGLYVGIDRLNKIKNIMNNRYCSNMNQYNKSFNPIKELKINIKYKSSSEIH